MLIVLAQAAWLLHRRGRLILENDGESEKFVLAFQFTDPHRRGRRGDLKRVIGPWKEQPIRLHFSTGSAKAGPCAAKAHE